MTNKKKILVAGKDTALSAIIDKELGDDYDIACTGCTDAALKDVCYTENPDFIILDVMMPQLDGIGVCLTLRQWSHVPIMMLSTWGTGGDMVRALNLGSENYLTEPFGAGELKVRISDTLLRNAATADSLSNIGSSGLL